MEKEWKMGEKYCNMLKLLAAEVSKPTHIMLVVVWPCLLDK